MRHRGAKLLLQRLDGHTTVFERIMEDGGNDRRRIHLQVGQDGGDLQRMHDIRVA